MNQSRIEVRHQRIISEVTIFIFMHHHIQEQSFDLKSSERNDIRRYLHGYFEEKYVRLFVIYYRTYDSSNYDA